MIRRVLVDNLVLGVLLCLPAPALVAVYGSGAPVLVWAVAAAVPLVVVSVLAMMRWPLLVTVPVSALLLVAAGPSLLALTPTLPTGPGIALLGRGLVTGWREMLTVAVPIGTAGGLLVPPLACGAISGLAAGLLARTGRPASALLPVLAVGVVAGLLGRSTSPPGLVPVLVGADLVLGLGWVAWRRGEGIRTVGTGRARWRRPLTAGLTLLVAAGAGVAVATTDPGDRLALRTGLAVPVDPAALPSPLTEFRHLSVDLAETELLSVTGSAPGDLLRIAALSDYDGHTFAVSASDGPFGRIGSRRDPAATWQVRQIAVAVRAWRGAYLPTAGDLETIEFTGPRAAELTERFRYAGTASTGLMPGGPVAGDGWRQRGVEPALGAEAVPDTDRIVVAVRPATIPVPDPLRTAAQRWTEGAGSPAGQLRALVSALREQGYYSQGRPGQLPSPPGHGLNRLVDMVSGQAMVGDAEQYAALLAVLARSLGIPARVVVGFRVPPSGLLTGADLTAWVEVPFAGSGWVRYDPTPPADRTSVLTEPQAPAGRHIADNQPPPAAAGGDSAQVQSGDQAQHPDRGQDEDRAGDRPAAGLRWWGWVLIGLGGLLALLVLPALAVLSVKWVRGRRRRRATDPGSGIKAAWRELLDAAADAGLLFPVDRTREQVGAELARIGVPAGDAARLADLADFSPAPPGPDLAVRQWAAVDRARAAILQRLSPTRRIRARLSPASLRRR